MKRRDFVVLVGSAAVWPFAAQSQQGKGPARIGFLFFGSPSNMYDVSLVEAFRQGLRQVGLVENRDVVLDIVWISGNPDDAVKEAIKRGAEILVPSGSSASVAAKLYAGTTPIVFISVGNPVGMELVDNLSRPGRNVTGFSDMLGDLAGKLVEIAQDFAAGSRVIDYLWHTAWPDGHNRFRDTELAASNSGTRLRSRGIANVAEIDDGIASMKNNGALILVVQPSPFTFLQRRRLIESAANQGLAMIFAFPIAAKEGALVAYGPDYVDLYRRAPLYVDRILKGSRPADLPVEQPTKIQMIINVKTARALGINVPTLLMLRADELIE
jgi:putative ABC transport system substrate-binding protein